MNGRTIRRANPEEAPAAVAILLEASTWIRARGVDVWDPEELPLSEFSAAARAGELLLGFECNRPAATMTLQTLDLRYWPEMAPGSALYLHKIAVARQFGGQGWLRELVGFAGDQARDRGITCLRLDTLAGTALRGLYEALGFVALEEAPIVVRGRDLIRMERPL